jgi:hypothetical protein
MFETTTDGEGEPVEPIKPRRRPRPLSSVGANHSALAAYAATTATASAVGSSITPTVQIQTLTPSTNIEVAAVVPAMQTRMQVLSPRSVTIRQAQARELQQSQSRVMVKVRDSHQGYRVHVFTFLSSILPWCIPCRPSTWRRKITTYLWWRYLCLFQIPCKTIVFWPA